MPNSQITTEVSDQFSTSKLSVDTPTSNALQDGNLAYHHENATASRLFNINRLTRRIPTYTNTSFPSTSSPVPMETEDLQLHVSGLRLESVTNGVHQGTQTSSQMGQATGNQDNRLHGRPTTDGTHTTAIPSTDTTGMCQINGARMAHQLEEVPTDPFSNITAFGYEHQYQQHAHLCTGHKDSGHSSSSPPPASQGHHTMDNSGAVHWQDDGDPTGEPTGSFPNTVHAQSTQPLQKTGTGTNYTNNPTRTDMADHTTSTMEWHTHLTTTGQTPNIHGCFEQRLWNCREPENSIRHLDNRPEEASYQRTGTTDSLESTSVDDTHKQPTHSDMPGQPISHSIPAQLWRHQITTSQPASTINLDLLLPQAHHSGYLLCPLGAQPSGCSFSTNVNPDRMDVTTPSVPRPGSTMGTTPSGPICFSTQPPLAEFRDLAISPGGSLDRRVYPAMDEEPGSTLHSTAVEHHSQMPATSHTTPSTSNPYNTGLANSTLVSISTASCGSTSSTPGLTNSQPKRHREESELADDRLGPRRKEPKQFSELTEAILRRGATNNPSTVSRQRLFIAWCHLTEQEPYEPALVTILNYLSSQQCTKKWKTSTLQSHLSAILSLYAPQQRRLMQESEQYKVFLKGLRKGTLRPLKTHQYDITPSLQYLHSLGDTTSLPLDHLTAKTAWLLAMVGFLRPSDIQRINIDQCSIC